MTRDLAIELLKALKNGLHETGKDFPYRDEVIPIAKEALDMAIKALEQEPCEDKRLYIKVFADLEPDDIAEKIYQICDEDKFPKVIESLKEYFDSEPCEDAISRQAVIDCLNADFTIDGKENMETVVDYINGAFEQIKALPSVKPTHKEWIPVPEGATNKDMFKAVFGYEPATDAVVCNKADWCGDSEPCNYCISNPNNIGREEDWWNAPYKAESEDKE